MKDKLIKFLIGLLFLFTSIDLATGKETPQFERFSVKIYQGTKALLNLESHAEAKNFRTRLQKAIQKAPNFAGHFVFTAWGCGASCLMPAIINVKTGDVYFPDFVVIYDPNKEPFEFKPNSRLLIIHGSLGEEAPIGTFYFRWDEHKLVPLP